jgi:alkylhydroperoxidase/carboxymuconolactone decarboxylase family protein YurZ
MTRHLDRLRRLSMGDRQSVLDVLAGDASDAGARGIQVGLDPRTLGLVRVAALAALDGPDAAVDAAVSGALAAGATPDDIVDTLIGIGPTIGSARLVSGAPKLAMALGYDVGADLEELGPGPSAS